VREKLYARVPASATSLVTLLQLSPLKALEIKGNKNAWQLTPRIFLRLLSAEL
jgi:hypothetical protein